MPATKLSDLTPEQIGRLSLLLSAMEGDQTPKIAYPAHEQIAHSHKRKSADLTTQLQAGSAYHQAHVNESLVHLHKVVSELIDHVKLPDPAPRPDTAPAAASAPAGASGGPTPAPAATSSGLAGRGPGN